MVWTQQTSCLVHEQEMVRLAFRFFVYDIRYACTTGCISDWSCSALAGAFTGNSTNSIFPFAAYTDYCNSFIFGAYKKTLAQLVQIVNRRKRNAGVITEMAGELFQNYQGISFISFRLNLLVHPSLITSFLFKRTGIFNPQ